MITPEFVLTVVGTGIGIIVAMGALILTLFLWNRAEANTDRRAMAEEMKDFHSRLLAIEERRNKFLFKE
jgi:hypothetical protein